MDDDWDLHAVVRSCSSTTSTSTAATTTAAETSCGGQECNISGSQDLFFEPRKDSFIEGLHDLLKPFLPKQQFSPKTNLPVSPHSVLGRFQDLSSHHPQVIKQFPHQKQELFSVVNASKPTPRSKKRKNHLKRVCHIPAESLSSDMWSWRKYGQKPIKGSPYPRGYYRCSTSKGCMARKQVERNRSDPGMFIVTYTGEHNHPMPTHRNSLAGSTRHKPTSDDSKKHEMSPEKMEEELDDDEEEDDDFSPSKMALDDDFFAGLEDFAGECLSDPIKTDLEFPWLGNTAATTATTTTTAAEGGS